MNFDNTVLNPNTTAFRHSNSSKYSPYTENQKKAIYLASTLGVATSLAVLSKSEGYSLSIKKIGKLFKDVNYKLAAESIIDCFKSPFKKISYKNLSNNFSRAFSPLKKTYLYKAPYDEKEVISMGLGSSMGGLIAGSAIDKDKSNRKSKCREAVMQIANVSVPILFVGAFARGGDKLGKKIFKGSKGPAICRATCAIIGIFTGVYASNIIANKLNDKIFKTKTDRPVQLSDYSAHLDDFCMAARQISHTNPLIHAITMCIPIALIVPGKETGNKTSL